MYCSKCGAYNTDSNKFCSKCGKKITYSYDCKSIKKRYIEIDNESKTKNSKSIKFAHKQDNLYTKEKKHEINAQMIVLLIVFIIILFIGAGILLFMLFFPVDNIDADADITEQIEVKKTDSEETKELLGDVDIDASNYYYNNSTVVSVTKVEESNRITSEKETIEYLKDRGFDQFDITTMYDINGDYYSEDVVVCENSNKHPMYQTYYINSNDNVWTIYFINGCLIAYPSSFIIDSGLEYVVLITENETITSYDCYSNSFYETIPDKSNIITIQQDRIDTELLEELTYDEIEKLIK